MKMPAAKRASSFCKGDAFRYATATKNAASRLCRALSCLPFFCRYML